MKIIPIILILLLSGCTDLTSREQELLGHWIWELGSDGFKEKGCLKLRDDRTYAIEYSSSNPTERIAFKRNHDDTTYWRSIDQKVCIATSWGGGGLFQSVVVKEETCLWDIIEDLDGNIALEFKYGFTQGGVIAKKQDKNF